MEQQYKIVDFYTNKDTGITVNTIEEAKDIIYQLEKTHNTRYIPLTEEEFDDTITEIY